jgi:signal transduction histidine kinase
VQLFDGKISVESSIGNGTSFILDFPSGETDL